MIRRLLPVFIFLVFVAAGLVSTSSITKRVVERDCRLQQLSSIDTSQKVTFSLREGDIVLRRGKSMISQLLRRTSLHDQTFSHAGMVYFEDGRWKVLHAIGGQGSSIDGVCSEDWSQFCAAQQTDTIAVFRLTDDSRMAHQFVTTAIALGEQCSGFDTDFDLSTDNKLYCTELIQKAVFRASKGSISLPLTTISGVTYISCENIYTNHYVQHVHSFSAYEF